MRRALAALLVAASLAACGNLSSVQPTAGELLGAPVSLNMGGRSVALDAAATLRGERLSVAVRLPARAALQVREVYVVTQGGVWRGQVSATGRSGASLQASASGPARGLRPGEAVQVVARVEAQGKSWWVRDAAARVGR
ncbi:hypothetical protein ACFP81_01470 [Deinococcus lacus]|uniref:Lipoprotein n=1 Tax=Deinococcus lacus TaxID=392561 RepID=A0ABW1Y965_9DEIO